MQLKSYEKGKVHFSNGFGKLEKTLAAEHIPLKASKQASKHASKQASKQGSKQARKQASK